MSETKVILTKYSRVQDLMEVGETEGELVWGKNDQKVLQLVRDKIGNMWLTKIGEDDIQFVMDETLRESGSPFIANQFRHITLELFRYALRQRVIICNPTMGIGHVAIIPRKKDGYTRRQWIQIHEAICEVQDYLLQFHLYTGFYMQDVVHLRITDCFGSGRRIEIGGYGTRRRTIQLGRLAWSCLAKAIREALIRRTERGTGEMDYVFSNEDGGMLTNAAIRSRADVIRRKSGQTIYSWIRTTDHQMIQAVNAGATSVDLMHYFGILDERSAIMQWDQAKVNAEQYEEYADGLSNRTG